MRKVEIAAHPPHQQFIKPYGCQSSFRILQQFSFCDIQFVFQHVPARIAVQFISRHCGIIPIFAVHHGAIFLGSWIPYPDACSITEAIMRCRNSSPVTFPV